MQRSDSFTRIDSGYTPSNAPKELPSQRTGQRVAQLASKIVILVGCAVLIGWKLDLVEIKSIIPGLATMKANTALCLVLAGISLGLQAHPTRSWRSIRIADGCTMGVIIVALLTICQYLFWWHLGIDELLVRDLDAPATSFPGRMGINTAVNFCLVGVALWLMNRPEQPSTSQPAHQVRIDRVTIAQIMTAVAAAIALQALIGYAYHVRVFYQFSVATTSMALHTALSFGVLCVGMLALGSDRGFMRALTNDLMGGKIAQRLIPVAILAPILVGWLILQGLKANLYDPNFALSLMSMAMAIVWLGLIRQNAGILNQMDYDRIRSTDRMRSSQERLKLALSGAKQGIWEVDVQTQMLTWDDRCNAMFGFSPDAVVTYALAIDKIHPDDRDRVVAAVDTAIRDWGEFAQEYRIMPPDGMARWVLVQGRVYGDPTGTHERMLGTMMDISDRKHAELNERFLNRLTRRLRRLTDADDMQWDATHCLGEYLNVDRVTWYIVDWAQRLATVDLDWHRDGLVNRSGAVALGDFLPPELQVALFAGESVSNGDVTTDPLLTPYLDNYRQLGTRAFTNIPCIKEGHWVANLNISTTNARIWRDDDITLMQAFVAQIWSLVEQTRSVQALRAQEQQTKESEQRFSAIFNNSFGLIGLFDTEGVVLNLNQAALASVDARSVDIIGKKCWETPWWRHSPQLQQQLRQSIVSAASGRFVRYEVQFPNASGGNTTTDFSLKPVFDESGQVVTIVAEGRDITDLKQIEAQLRSSERKFSAVFNQTFELMGLLSLEGIVLEVNQSALDSISAQAPEIIGKYFWDTPWWQTEQLQQQLRDAIATAASGRFVRYEVEFPNGNGELTITDFSLKPVLDEANRVVTIIAEAHDITERKQAAAALREGEERFRTLADNMSQLAWMTEPDGWIFWYNRRWFEYTGTTLEQMQGWGWQQVHHPDHLDRVVTHFRHHLTIGQAWEDTFPLRGRDGTYRWFLSRAIPIFDAAGRVIRWFGTNTDITEQQATLLELERAQANLKARNQELDSFVHVVAHDLKAPLRGIFNLSEWIEDDLEGVLSAEIQQHTTLLRNRVQRMAATIDGLLDYARIDRIDATIEPVEVAALLAEAIDSIAPPPTFTIVIAPDLPTIYTKRLFLFQVFTNLIGNSIKHHDRLDGSIQISCQECGDLYEFRVADDGPGIAPAQHDRVFEIFTAMNPQNRADSTGIGLAIVKKIIEAEGGTIRLESDLECGTKFYFTWHKGLAI
jgi:PAS domain S-box-containing protein